MNEFESDWISSTLSGVTSVFEWISKSKITGCLNPILASVSESKMAEFKMAAIMQVQWECMSDSFFVQNSCHHQDGRIQEWMSLSQIKLIWVGLRVEWECFWVNLREENKVSESNIAECRDGHHHQVESEFNKGRFFLVPMVGREVRWKIFVVEMVGTNLGKCEWSFRGKTKMAESRMAELKMAEFRMAAILKLSENEWVWVRLN